MTADRQKRAANLRAAKRTLQLAQEVAKRAATRFTADTLHPRARENVRMRGMSQEELALDADMKRSYVSDLERGARNPSVRAVERLAAALKVGPDELLRRD